MDRGRVAVAMSGGVDSSVAAAMLVEQGYEVVGLTMQIWPRDTEAGIPPGLRGCCGLDALDSARQVARTLGIPHYVIELREPFERFVVDPFCDEYAAGRTPNPCIRCNTFVKFGPLLQRAAEVDARQLATGHYARVGYDEVRERWVLRRGVDTEKDQSYSLYGLSQEQLARAAFPLGETTKSHVRERARRLGLPAAERPESQEVCFVSEGRYVDYLRGRRPELARTGPIVDRGGRQLGRHRGVAFYTIGQRQGLRISRKEPLYVIGIDVIGNRLIVGGEQELESPGLLMQEVNYVSVAGLPKDGSPMEAKIRSGARLVECTAWADNGAVRLEFARPQRAIAPGQAAVCYEGDAVALGGVIESQL
jgi:tRNA-specific 2-thiouridylase